MKWPKIFIWCSVWLAFMSACTQAQEKKERLMVVCTTGMLADAVQQITGPDAEVIALMGPGVDPHLYKATQGDLQKLQDADIIVYNGLHLEGKMSEVLEALSAHKTVIAASDGIDPSSLRMLGAKVSDPHIWFDVKLWSKAVAHLAKQLSQADTLHRADYLQRHQMYQRELLALDSLVRTSLSAIPPPQRVLITAHDAFGYFGAAYQMEVRGLQGLSTVSDYGLNDVTTLVDFIVERKINAIFTETSVSDKSIQAVLQGCNSKGHQVKLGGSLYSDAMGATGTPEGTYSGMVKKNVETIVNALL
ncbi:MAG: zinc ABC transporter substrate-binding protein [Cytophagaceae bacterium]|jgi:manganese/zinc/iron transport system substrate-binding protein|nr:zinc ABC transporter substrate-binding protein [Cytophagaceae bacterium]